MAEKKKTNRRRTQVKNLSQKEKQLTPKEAKKVKGGKIQEMTFNLQQTAQQKAPAGGAGEGGGSGALLPYIEQNPSK